MWDEEAEVSGAPVLEGKGLKIAAKRVRSWKRRQRTVMLKVMQDIHS